MRPKAVVRQLVPLMPSVFRLYYECGKFLQSVCLLECECDRLSVVGSDDCDSAVSCIYPRQ